jgi:hypothetical protein
MCLSPASTKRAGQRFYSDSIRRQALALAVAGATPADVLAERHALANRAEAGIAEARAAIARAALAAILATSPIFEAIQLADGQAPPEVAARLTVDPWTGQPIRRARVPR